jgi:hypothetical protein
VRNQRYALSSTTGKVARYSDLHQIVGGAGLEQPDRGVGVAGSGDEDHQHFEPARLDGVSKSDRSRREAIVREHTSMSPIVTRSTASATVSTTVSLWGRDGRGDGGVAS